MVKMYVHNVKGCKKTYKNFGRKAKNMERLLEMFTDNSYWESTFVKLMEKTTVTPEEKAELSECYAIDREDIIKDIITGNYIWSIPRKVELRKSGTTKKRVVYIYSIKDRLVLGALYHIFSEYFKDLVSDSCYSYKKGCNTLKAVNVIRNENVGNKKYGVKVDIHAYFNNISDNRLYEMIDELFPTMCGLRLTLENLLCTNMCEFHGEIIDEYKGVIPGTPLASFFANYCLRECDFYFDNKDCIYARYSDDIIVLEDTQEELDRDLEKIKGYLAKYGLILNEKKYEYFLPGDVITFLGLKIESDGTIDISDHSKQKIKKQIHRWCRKGRIEIEMKHKEFMPLATKINNRLNSKNFKCYIRNEGTFGWCHYAFRYINTDKSLKEIDLYTKDTLRAMKTGKHNKANYKALSEEDFKQMNWVSLVQLFHLYKRDFDYYCEVIDLF